VTAPPPAERHAEIDADFHDARTVVRAAAFGPALPAPAKATPGTSKSPSSAPPRPRAEPARRDVQEISTARLGLAAVGLMIVAAFLGALLFYLVAR
jgi:hypothetical protein